jgi:alpha-tubulin suppressor-like RCC1 family protein
VWHTAAVVDDGQLYTWGDGDGGKLGHADVTDDVPVPTPRRVADWTPGGGGGGGGEEKNASEIVVIVAASCGQSHTLALDANGVAWCLGSVGKTGAPPPPTPRRIASIPDAVASLSSGDSHAAALTRRGRLYVWGVGKRGALGHGGFGEELAPRLLEGALEGRTIREVTCGPESTAVVVDAAALTKREKIEVRSIHWSPYDRVGDVDADP